MKKPVNLPKRLLWFVLTIGLFVLISLISDSRLWIKGTLYAFWATYALIGFLKIIFYGTKYSVSGAYLLFYLGCLMIAMFIVWLGNAFLLGVNLLLEIFELQFKFGLLFKDVYHYIFSLPSLISGLVMMLVSVLWENDAQYKEWHQKLFHSQQKKFRREFDGKMEKYY